METILDLKSYENAGWHSDPLELNIKIDNIKETIVTSNNCNYLGCGSYSWVYDLPEPNKVVKICCVCDLSKDAYYNYLGFVMENQDNPFVPKIEKITKFKIKDTGHYDKVYCYCVIMEKLLSIRDVSGDDLLKMINDLFVSEYSIISPIYEAEYISQPLRKAVLYRNYSKIKNNDLVIVLRAIRNLINKNNFSNDIGLSNIMMRPSDKHLVVTDPIS